MVKFTDNFEKLGLDDCLDKYKKDYFQQLVDNAETQKTKDELLWDLVQPISSVQTAKSIEWIVPNMFAKGYASVIFGEAGSCKTWIVLDFATKITTGMPVFDGIETTPHKVILFEGDTTNVLIKERINKLKLKVNDNFLYINRYDSEMAGLELDLSSEKGRDYIERIIIHRQPDVIIFDTLISYVTNEKDPVEMKIVIDFLRTLANKHNCHILICHHARKRESGERRNKFDQSDLIGSSVINRLASFIIATETADFENDLEDCPKGKLSLKKTWFKSIKPIIYKVRDIDADTVQIDYETTVEEKRGVNRAVEAITNYVKSENIKNITRKELVSKFSDIPETTIKKALTDMVQLGLFEATGSTKDRIYKTISPEIEPNKL